VRDAYQYAVLNVLRQLDSELLDPASLHRHKGNAADAYNQELSLYIVLGFLFIVSPHAE